MAIIKCKMCGGDMELSPDQSCATCEYCGSTMTIPKVDDDQRAAAFNRGNHFRRIGEFDKALAAYEAIVREDDGDAEAHWCCALCRFGIEYVRDPASGEYLPTCHRASFDSFLEDVDYQAALRHADAVAREQYRKDGEKIAEVQRGILTISQKEPPFDVFLCHKETDDKGQRTVDSTLAQEIYYELTEQGRRVFFARITLEDKAGQQYEPYIFAALHSAKVMVVVGTKPEYLNAVWVKNEWSRYLALMKNDRKRLLIPCYRDMDPYDLPEQLSVLQSYDMGKIGFLQDLTRGIAKVLDAGKQPAAAPAAGGGGGNMAALLKRGSICRALPPRRGVLPLVRLHGRGLRGAAVRLRPGLPPGEGGAQQVLRLPDCPAGRLVPGHPAGAGPPLHGAGGLCAGLAGPGAPGPAAGGGGRGRGGGHAMREEVVRQDRKLEKDVAAMRALQSKAAALAGRGSGSPAADALAQLAEDLRYSDPVSAPALEETERELAACIDQLEQALVAGDGESVQALCARAGAVLAERNRLCKLHKHH